MHHFDITVSIVSYNTRDLLLGCLQALHDRQEEGEAKLQVIVADNGSSDGSVAAVRTAFPDVLLVETGANLGYGRANNLALEHAGAPYFLILNSDTEMPPGALRAMREYLDGHPDVGAVGPQLLWPDGRLQTSHGPDPSFRGIVQEQMMIDKLLQLRATPSSVPAPDAGLVHEVEQLCGACSMVRASAFRQVHGFDPAYFMYHEDVDLNIRLRRAGWRLMFLPRATVVHHLGASSVRHWETRARMIQALNWSRYYYYHHHGSPAQGRFLKMLFVAGALLRLTAWSLVALARPSAREKVKLFRRVLRGASRMRPGNSESPTSNGP